MNIEKIQKQINQKIEYYEKIDSTHIYAKKIEKQGDKILIAEEQTGGIGTKGRNWHSGKSKNIAITIIKHPMCKIKELEGLTTKIAETIVESIYELYGIRLQIKIPNDLLLNGKKICGILTEIHTRGENIEYMLISFGFNVNEETFNPEIEGIATSLKKEFHKEFNREEIIIKILNKINDLI